MRIQFGEVACLLHINSGTLQISIVADRGENPHILTLFRQLFRQLREIPRYPTMLLMVKNLWVVGDPHDVIRRYGSRRRERLMNLRNCPDFFRLPFPLRRSSPSRSQPGVSTWSVFSGRRAWNRFGRANRDEGEVCRDNPSADP